MRCAAFFFILLFAFQVFAGPITDDMNAEDYRKEHAEKVCNLKWLEKQSWPKTKAKDCSDKWFKSFYSRLELTYDKADRNFVQKQCEAFPIKCADLANIESWFETSHYSAKTEDDIRKKAERGRELADQEELEHQRRRRTYQDVQKAADKIGCSIAGTCE